MAKTKSPPGHEETTLVSLQAELVAFNQRCTQMEMRLQQQIDVAYRHIGNAGIIAFVTFLAATTYIAGDVWKALK